MPRLRLCLNIRLTLFTLFFLPLLVMLGFWQLDRAKQKSTLLENWSQQQADTSVVSSLRNITTADEGKTVRLEGTYDIERYWLKEAQVLNGKLGQLVMGLVETTQNLFVIVNMGWVPSNPDRTFITRVELPSSLQPVSGRLTLPSDSPLTNESDNPQVAWPHRILEVDFEVMSEQCNCTLAPLVIDLHADDINAFEVLSRKINISPEKHRGYALQWFMMALALSILWVVANTNIITLLRR